MYSVHEKTSPQVVAQGEVGMVKIHHLFAGQQFFQISFRCGDGGNGIVVY